MSELLRLPGTPVAVACPDRQVRGVRAAYPLGGHLIVTASLFSAVSADGLTANICVPAGSLRCPEPRTRSSTARTRAHAVAGPSALTRTT